MATVSEKWEDNVPGPYYVDKTCTFCCVCIEEAPENFKESEDGDHAYVSKQPETPEEVEAVKAAIEGCPSESIGDDGA